MLLGEIFFLADKYQVDAMKVAITKNVKTREVNENDVLDAAKVSEANIHLVEFANALDVLCVEFVLSLSILELSELFNMYQSEEKAPVLYRLVSKVKKLKEKVEVGKKCKNCRKFPCITGSKVTMHNCVLGAFVNYNSVISRVTDFKDNLVIIGHSTDNTNKFRFKCD